MTVTTTSLAVAQRSLGDPAREFPLLPVLTTGCPVTSDAEMQYPLEIAFDYARVPQTLFDQAPLPGLERWAPLLPPLAAGLSMAEGGTPLHDVSDRVAWEGGQGPLLVKDETRNPTWSHKDRLNLCTVSAAIASGAPGIVVSSSGNHGAAAAAYAARAELPCIVLTSDTAPPAVQSFLLAYGAAVIAVPAAARWPLMRQIVERFGFHPVSNLTAAHTGHPYGPEGYKTIAYELFLQLDRQVPAAVFVPTGYAELLYGVWKGFHELRLLGVTSDEPRLIACEPAARAPLAKALAEGRPAAEVPAAPTDALAIAVTVSGYRGVVAIQQSGGAARQVSDAEMAAAQTLLARAGLWVEIPAAAGLAAARQAASEGERFAGPVVVIATSSGFKDVSVGHEAVPVVAPDWPAVAEMLRTRYGLSAA
jgi:threonine synthase